ncbi:MAG: protein kinase [Kofleriaceae bacterium]
MKIASALTTRLGRYQLVRHLATGGMADVLLARATGIEGFERHVVIKRIHAEHARDARFVQMFLDEARLAATLHHHNIVHVHDIGQEGGEYFFAMEYLHGEDLRKLLMRVAEREARVPLEHVLTIMLAAASALHYAHELKGPDRKLLGVVHRDVSPANIHLGYDGHVKVVDFGIAKASQRTTETQSGVMKGKVAYMSPEQCIGQAVDRRSDIFCLGIVLYEMCTVRRLFKGANDFLTMSSITHGEIPRPSTIVPDLAPELETIIMKALAARPEDRYQTADALRAELEQFAIARQLRTSSTALADYMVGQFGERAMPWLVDDEEPELELSYDFDGSASGIAHAPPLESVAIAEGQAVSPLARARTRAISNPPPIRREPHRWVAPPGRPPTTQTLSPITSGSRRIWLATGAAAVLAVAIIATVLASSREPRALPAATEREVPVVQPMPVAAEPVPVAQPVVAPPEQTVEQPVEILVAKPVDPIKKTKKKRVPVKGKWDPDALFPKK